MGLEIFWNQRIMQQICSLNLKKVEMIIFAIVFFLCNDPKFLSKSLKNSRTMLNLLRALKKSDVRVDREIRTSCVWRSKMRGRARIKINVFSGGQKCAVYSKTVHRCVLAKTRLVVPAGPVGSCRASRVWNYPFDFVTVSLLYFVTLLYSIRYTHRFT